MCGCSSATSLGALRRFGPRPPQRIRSRESAMTESAHETSVLPADRQVTTRLDVVDGVVVGDDGSAPVRPTPRGPAPA